MVALVRIPSEVAQQIAPKASVAELQQAQGQQEHEKLDKDVEEALEEQAPALLSESEATLRERDIEIQEIERIAKDLGCVFENGRIIVQDDYDAKLAEMDAAISSNWADKAGSEPSDGRDVSDVDPQI